MTIKKIGKALLSVTAVLLATCGLMARSGAADKYDVVILNGRVMDPESGLDAIRNIGIRDGKILVVTKSALRGRETIDAKGLVVAPGFIDLHEHAQFPRSYAFQARDGVTTSLELEMGTDDVDKWYADREGKTLINYGVSIGESLVRMDVMAKVLASTPLEEEEASHRTTTSEEQKKILELVEKGLRQGALAVGYGINYTPGASRWEIFDSFQLAAKYGAMNDVHMRFLGTVEPGSAMEGLQELIADATATGASLNVVHITSIGLRDTPRLLDVIKGARGHGLDISTECYPYTAASAPLNTALFDSNWQERMGITYQDLQWVATGERLTAETFAKYRNQEGAVVIHLIPEEIVRLAVADPMVIIASDGMPISGPKIHPRGQGTYSRVLGLYVRQEKVLSMMEALRKMTLMPAQRLENHAPAFKYKGRIRVGADADITAFDPERIIDKATFEDPLQYSEGVEFVLVNGIPVVRESRLVQGVTPGRAARAPIIR
ncbi:MAG: amidohydrolase family protein [Candidatus Acidiferrales bacterium]